MQLLVVKGLTGTLTNLLHRQVRVMGVYESSPGVAAGIKPILMVPSLDQIQTVQVVTPVSASDSKQTLTAVEQVRRLNPSAASQHVPTKISGVIIWTSSFSFVLEDSTGGVYVHDTLENWTEQPRLGELWEVEGTTGSGDFSPVIWAQKTKFLGHAAFPPPIHPTWDQLMNGSLDAEYVEIRGVLTAISTGEMTLFTPDGLLKITANVDHPLPRLPIPLSKTDIPADDLQSYVGRIVEMHGCLTAVWNYDTREVEAGEIHLTSAFMNVEDAEGDPFLIPQTSIEDLMRFNARANALQRTKVAAQIIYATPTECCLQNGSNGLRVLLKDKGTWQPGDLVEAVGFPRLNGATPVLLEAQIRKIGQAPLPQPIQISSNDLLSQKHDSTLVLLEAIVVSDVPQMSQRILELQAGANHFLAILRWKNKLSETVPPGSRVRLTGVYSLADTEGAGGNLDRLELLLNNASDISVLQKPSWWTMRRVIMAMAILTAGLGITLIWIMLLRQKVEERTRQLQKEIEERQRVEQHRAMEQERTRVAQDLHDELGVGLTQVGMLGSLARNPALSTEQKDLYLEQLSGAARTLVTGLDEIVWAVNPKYDSVASLASYFALFTQRFLNLAGVACRFEAAANLPDYPLDPRLRHGLFLAFKEALNNIVRHAKATEVHFKIEAVQNHLIISIADDGCGFESTSEAPGLDGLTGMRERMKQLEGECTVKSQLGQGTTIEFSLPLEKNRV